jgi:Protein of unknown function (DUF4058)
VKRFLMPSPFPGMDPYLEDPEIWSGVHAAILGAIQNRLGPAVRPHFVVRYAERVYRTNMEDPAFRLVVPDLRVIGCSADQASTESKESGVATVEPIRVEVVDDEIHDRSLQVIDVRDRSVVTVIEVLSPTNKMPGSLGRASFLQKRKEVAATDAHWIEIDLLREGERTAHLPRVPDTEYQAYMSRAGKPRRGYVWPISLRKPLPAIAIPLRGEDPDVPLDLQAVINSVIERGSYDLDTDYSREPVPPLQSENAEWARQIVASLRQS